LIVHLPFGALFANAIEVGIFVKNFVSRVAGEQANGLMLQRDRKVLAKYFLVNSAPPQKEGELKAIEKTCFVDTGVYTRNRLFRIVGSSKYGKPHSASLRIADVNTFPFSTGFDNSKFYKLEKTSSGDQADSCEDEDLEYTPEVDLKNFEASMDWSAHAEALEKTLVVPLEWSRSNFPILPLLTENAKVTSKGVFQITRNPRAKTSKNSHGPSPFPTLDKFILSEYVGSRGGIQCEIRTWSIAYNEDERDACEGNAPSSIKYQISKNRFCEHVGRHHKSNGIMWTVDLSSFYCFQSCWDPDCRAQGFYHGKYIYLPVEIKQAVQEELFEMTLLQMNIDDN